MDFQCYTGGNTTFVANYVKKSGRYPLALPFFAIDVEAEARHSPSVEARGLRDCFFVSDLSLFDNKTLKEEVLGS